MNMTLLIPILAGLSVTLIVLGFALGRRAEPSLEERLDRYATREVELMEERKKGKLTEEDSTIAGRLNRVIVKKESADKIAAELARADLKLKVSEYILINIASIILFALLGQLIFRSPLLALASGVFGYFAPRLYVKRRQAQRLNAFNDQLGDAINLLANSLRSGYSLLQSLETVSREMAPPLATEFARVVQEVGLGLSIEQALANMLRRVRSDDLDMMVTAINIQHEVGGNLAEILETISFTIRERVRIKGEIRVLTAQQMLTAYIISFLPVGLGLILYAINHEYIGLLFSEPCGWIMVVVGVIIITAGYLVIRKIVAIEV
ncbi:MAG: type II secretion system F family protein [Anaerolineae bacterium]|nr:type II secretion system F family protein [Anaerolineae bacterium]